MNLDTIIDKNEELANSDKNINMESNNNSITKEINKNKKENVCFKHSSDTNIKSYESDDSPIIHNKIISNTPKGKTEEEKEFGDSVHKNLKKPISNSSKSKSNKKNGINSSEESKKNSGCISPSNSKDAQLNNFKTNGNSNKNKFHNSIKGKTKIDKNDKASSIEEKKQLSSPKNEQIEKKSDEKKEANTSRQKQRQIIKGPKLPTFKKPDNQNLIRNAIATACLAGEANKKRREEILEDFKSVPKGRNVIILFKDPSGARQDIKAIYMLNEEAEVAEFVYGAKDSPSIIGRPMVNNYYRYDSGAKKFRLLQGNKNFSIAVDAVSIKIISKKKFK